MAPAARLLGEGSSSRGTGGLLPSFQTHGDLSANTATTIAAGEANDVLTSTSWPPSSGARTRRLLWRQMMYARMTSMWCDLDARSWALVRESHGGCSQGGGASHPDATGRGPVT
ncbi:hypothetical protein BS78_05G230900 [Paspalum vaginatum]|nr:hypothetical protein BS78_05G230900 [Paspalum vaginatum]